MSSERLCSGEKITDNYPDKYRNGSATTVVYTFPADLTMGGIGVDEFFRVMNTDGQCIPGLFAAGETIGRNYSNGIGACLVSGYDAAGGIESILSE